MSFDAHCHPICLACGKPINTGDLLAFTADTLIHQDCNKPGLTVPDD